MDCFLGGVGAVVLGTYSRRCFGIMRRILFIYGQLAEIDPCLATVTSDLIKGGL